MARVRAAGRRYVLRAAVARDLARHGCRGRIRGAEIQRPGVVRRPYAHARQLPLPARLYGRPGNRTGMAVERRALYAGLLGRADRPQPHGGRTCRLYARRPRRTYPQPRFRRPIYDRAGRAADAPLRLFLPPCPHAQLQTDARPAGGGSYHRHRPVPRGRRHLRQPLAKRPAPSRPHRPRGRPFRLRLCALDARGHRPPVGRVPFRPPSCRRRPRAGRCRRAAPRVLRERALPRDTVPRALAADGVYALYGQGTGGVGFLAPQLPRSIGRSRGCGARCRRPVLPAVV